MLRGSLELAAGLCVTVALVGCGGTKPAANTETNSDHAASGHTHDKWWCPDHGMPEEICVQCDAKLAAEYKQKGDWCAKHDRPDSQCFLCHPELEAKFAAQYEAKYGEKPPKPTAEGEGKEKHEHDKPKS